MRGRRGRPQPGSYRGQGLRIHFQPNTTQFRFVHCFVCSPPAIPAGPPRTDCKDPFEDSGGGEIPPPKVQFKLYQGEVLQYKPGASDHRCGRMDLALVQIDLYQELGESTQSETPESALQSERGTSSVVPHRVRRCPPKHEAVLAIGRQDAHSRRCRHCHSHTARAAPRIRCKTMRSAVPCDRPCWLPKWWQDSGLR